MRSPQDMETIQIDITNACIHRCSNCTRACGHHKRNFFMDWHTFKRAVDSLKGFNGTVGIMGGEPTLHPEFERFIDYLNNIQQVKKNNTVFIKPTKQFMKQMYYDVRESYKLVDKSNGEKMLKVTGFGLWSSLCSNYYKYYELIQDIFDYQCLNDHKNISYHQPVLVSRKDLNIPDDKWIEMRDKCWIQNNWSATITPKGAFFCEVAGMLDMLFDGDGGWSIESEWWKRTPDDFKDQLHWCELCGLALDTRRRNANECVDDVSPTLYEMLKNIKSPKLCKGNVRIYLSDETESENKNKELQFFKSFNYIDKYANRLSGTNKNIYPKGFEAIVFFDSNWDYNEFVNNVNTNIEQLDNIVILTDNVQNLKIDFNCSNIHIMLSSNLNFGKSLNSAFKIMDKDKFILILSPDIKLSKNFRNLLSEYVINPGTYHYNDFKSDLKFSFVDNPVLTKNSYISLFNQNAYALKEAGYDGISKCDNINEFQNLWTDNKQILFEDSIFEEAKEILNIESNKKYAIYGLGGTAKNIVDIVNNFGAEIKFCCDSDENKWNIYFMDKLVISPDELLKRKNEFDKIIIGSMRIIEIKTKLMDLGFDENNIMYLKLGLEG